MRRYVISTQLKTWGALINVMAPHELITTARGGRCYTVLAGRSEPCEGCPVQLAAFEHGRAVSVLAAPNDQICVATAIRTSRDTADVSVNCLRDLEVKLVVREKLARVARAAHLSAREGMVLDLLVLGQRSDEIATKLSISARTAKFHQANILKKLGVDSRIDLLRLLL
jgi:DNA-binding CsgD family transcriptional regulator